MGESVREISHVAMKGANPPKIIDARLYEVLRPVRRRFVGNISTSAAAMLPMKKPQLALRKACMATESAKLPPCRITQTSGYDSNRKIVQLAARIGLCPLALFALCHGRA